MYKRQVLLHFGLTAERLLPPLSVLDPDVAPAAFYAANLLLFAASLFVGYPVLRDGLTAVSYTHLISGSSHRIIWWKNRMQT